MAKSEKTVNENTAVAERPQNAVAARPVMDFAADAGAGLEGADSDSYALPFLGVLQKGSPQVDETVDGGAHLIEGAKAGMLFDNVTGRLFDGKTGVLIVPVDYRRSYVRWGARENGGGFKGELTVEEVAEMRQKGRLVEFEGRLYFPDANGEINPKKNDRVSDTRSHYVMIVDEKGRFAPALMSLTSTQIKKSKGLNSSLAAVRLPDANGKEFQPPTYANMVRVTTGPEQNDKGSWFGLRFTLEGQVENPDLYAAAKKLAADVRKGVVTAKYEDVESAESAEGASVGASESAAQGNKGF